MAKVASASVKVYAAVKKSRPGIHAKTKSSKMKKSRNYRKAYKGQGR
mgnify:CR=1 FL=1